MLGAEVCDAILPMLVGQDSLRDRFYRYRYRLARNRVVRVAWVVWMWLRHLRHNASRMVRYEGDKHDFCNATDTDKVETGIDTSMQSL